MRISKGTSKKPAQSLGTTEMPEEVVAVALENCERDSVAALAQDAVSVSMRVEQDQGRVSERYTELAAEYDRLDGEVRKAGAGNRRDRSTEAERDACADVYRLQRNEVLQYEVWFPGG